MSKLINVDIVSAESELYSGQAYMVIVSGAMGELGISYGHSPLLTTLKPGNVKLIKNNAEPGKIDEVIYFNGGLLEVQPHTVTILAQIGIRGADLDESAALAAKERAEQMLKNRERADFDYSLAASELAQALAQLRTIRDLRKKIKI